LAVASPAYRLSLGSVNPVVDGFTGDQRFLGWEEIRHELPR
jgi:predicted metalloendopeptidase